jgi:hypothetical protein
MAILVGLVCLTVGKTAYYGVERAVRPEKPATRPVVVRVKPEEPAREANFTSGDGKADRLR